MPRPTLEEVFADSDPHGLLDVRPSPSPRRSGTDEERLIAEQVEAFRQKHGRDPDPDAVDHDEMRLGTIWEKQMPDIVRAASPAPVAHWRDGSFDNAPPADIDDILDDIDLDVDASIFTLNRTTPSADRILPDHRAAFLPCTDFHLFASKFVEIQEALERGERMAHPVKKWAVIEPIEGDIFIRNGLFALIAEKSEMTTRGGSRDHRLRVIFSNGTESDPLMSSFRKSLTEDPTARVVEKVGLGPLDPEWEHDRLELSGTIYVLRSLSEEPVIKKDRMILHKIGVTSQDVRRRVADARNDPTFLMAAVEIVAEFALKNLPRHIVENLLHRFFDEARPDGLFVSDRFGKKIYPREWFYVLPEHVSQAAALIQNQELHLYRYDVRTQKIVRR